MLLDTMHMVINDKSTVTSCVTANFGIYQINKQKRFPLFPFSSMNTLNMKRKEKKIPCVENI